MKLKAPEGVCSASHDGIEYPVVNGIVDVPDIIAPQFRDSFGFTSAPAEAKPAEVELEDDDSEPTTDPDGMKRNELFAYLKASGVAVSLPIGNDELRDQVKKIIADKAALDKDVKGQGGSQASP